MNESITGSTYTYPRNFKHVLDDIQQLCLKCIGREVVAIHLLIAIIVFVDM